RRAHRRQRRYERSRVPRHGRKHPPRRALFPRDADTRAARQVRAVEESPIALQYKGPLMTVRTVSRPLGRAAFFALLLLFAVPLAAQAALVIDLSKPNPQPLPIAIPAFVGGNPNESQLGRDVAGVVSADLERSGLFRP